MNPIEKEHLLQKVVAVSGFLSALCILPLAQHFLVANQLPDGQTGQVAGASTDQSILHADVPAVSDSCLASKEQQKSDLDRYADGVKAAEYRQYRADTDPYTQAESQLAGTPEHIQSEKGALEKLIADRYQAYLDRLGAVEKAVDSQKKAVDSRSCLSE